jgi:predicted DNA-binding transcriptional regulator AlpA
LKTAKSSAEAPNIVDIAGEAIVREAEVRRLSGLSRATRWRMERAGRFPQSRRLSANAKGWFLSEILAWIAGRPAA